MSDPVQDAIGRWLEKDLVTPGQATALSNEAAAWTEEAGSRKAQYALATAAAVVSIVAAATFLGWAWSVLGRTGESLVLVAVAIALKGLGMYMEDRRRWRPVAYLLQVAGLGILTVAVAHSERAWADQSALGSLFGFIALATPLVMIPVTAQRNPFMPAAHTAFGYAFLYLFLDRALGLDWEEAIWILDLVLLASLAFFALRFRRDPEGSEWAVGALVAGLFAGMVLTLLTGLGPLDRGDEAILGLDLWYGLLVALTLWAIHQPDPALRRPWYGGILAWLVLLWVPIGYATTMAFLDVADAVSALVQGVVGGAAIAYGLRHGPRSVMYAGCFLVVVAAWVFGIQASGAIGAVVALGFTAALLFWIAGRAGSEDGNEATG
ncbi:MAG: hypothetical protein HKO53_00480 [Gemmatimonadetes bacterium]|nr:hypothetical protein [Gemmatimonadota bacterium]